jgi:outer membrane protein assembly factor BamA
MKPLFVVIFVLAGLPVSGADPQPFAPAPFRLESPRAASFVDSAAAVRATGMRLDFPMGPVRIDYGIPIRVQSYAPRGYRLLDAPGAGYREQRKRNQ